MSKHLVRDLENLQRQILGMAGIVEDGIYKSILALQERDKVLAHQVISSDARIDEYDTRITEECLKTLALHQPVAKDLRRIATVMMITTDLERIGDLATDIAERAIVLASPPLLGIPENLPRMTDLTTSMVRQSMDAFVNLDSKLARRVIRFDDEVDRYHAEIIDELRAMMHAKPELIDPALSMFSVVRHLERIGDHATNIAEDVVYLVEGEIVRHRRDAVAGDD
jgi:phosphate transport system protein